MTAPRWTGGERGAAQRLDTGAFFTGAVGAEMLARLSVRALLDDWSHPLRVARLRIADPACGAGILLEAARDECRRLQDEAGVLVPADPTLIGFDIDRPSLIEAARRLPGAALYLMPRGVQADGSVWAGSLELLDSSSDVWARAERIRAVSVRRQRRQVTSSGSSVAV